MPKHMIIPDTQVKPGVPTDHMTWAGKYAAEKRPDTIIFIGDHFDMKSLCIYDRGKKSAEGHRYISDIMAGQDALDKFLKPLEDAKGYAPRLVYTLGNHEERILRAVESDPTLEGVISYEDLGLEDRGFEVHGFKEVVVIDGVAYSHYFTSGKMGRAVASARLMLSKKHMSCVMGHVQDRDIAYAQRADGTTITGIFVGIFYQHYEEYLGAQDNHSWRGIWMLHEVQDGHFDEMPVSLEYLRKKYE